jgi:hypothetical protein
MTTKMKPLHFFVPIERSSLVEAEDGTLTCRGYAFVNEVVKGENGVCLKRSAMESATAGYREFGAIREMHQPSAAGTAIDIRWDEKGAYLEAKIVDPVAVQKVRHEVYKGFSVGVNPLVMRGNDVESCDWIETSLVDRPKDPDARLVFRADGFDPDAEVEVEVLPEVASDQRPVASGDGTQATSHSPLTTNPESPAPPPAGDATPAAEVADPSAAVEMPPTVPPPDAAIDESVGADATSQEPGASGGADLSPEREAVRVALIAQGISETRAAEMATEVEIAPVVRGAVIEHQAAGIITEAAPVAMVGASHSFIVPLGEMERAQSNGTISANPGATGHGSVTAPGPGVAEYQQLQDAVQRAQTSETVPTRENLEGKKPAEPIERYVKQKGSQWCVYSESGDELGCHDTKAEAVDQLQAIEANKKRAAVEEIPPAADPAQLVARLAEIRAEMDRFEALLRPVASGDGSVLATNHQPLTTSPTVSGEQPDEATALARVELSRVLRVPATEKLELNRLLGAATKRIRELENMPVREKPVVRYPHALSREFLVNLGHEGEAETTRLKREYQEAEAEAKAEREGDRTKRDRAIERMIACAGLLAERGVKV